MCRKGCLGAAILLVLALGACGWAYPGYDAANTGYNSVESTLSASNVSGLQYHWGGSIFGTAEILAVKRRAYVSDTNSVTAYDAAGVQGCSGSPKVCQPLLVFNRLYSCSRCDPFAVADDTVFAWSGVNNPQSGPTYIDAFDATGSKGCATDGMCSPVRRYDVGGGGTAYAPIVVGGILYTTSSNGGLAAFDAHGVRGCTTSAPVQCSSLWTLGATANASGSPVVAAGNLYIPTRVGLQVFDATGQSNCSGTTFRTCSPLWTSAPTPLFIFTPAVANGRVYASDFFGELRVWDANGQTGCSGTPRVCTPLWTANVNGSPGSGYGSPVVTSTYTLVPTTSDVLMYDALGKNACSGVPLTCNPIWSTGFSGRVTGANGLAVISGINSGDAALRIIDTRTQHPPTLWSLPLTPDTRASNAIIADGSLLVLYSDSLRSYGLG